MNVKTIVKKLEKLMEKNILIIMQNFLVIEGTIIFILDLIKVCFHMRIIKISCKILTDI